MNLGFVGYNVWGFEVLFCVTANSKPMNYKPIKLKHAIPKFMNSKPTNAKPMCHKFTNPKPMKPTPSTTNT